jgi:starch phosphorylase
VTRSQRPGPNLYDPEKFAREFTEELRFGQGVDFVRASDSDLYMALARTVRQALISRWIKTLETQIGRGSKAVVYLSAEYLLGRQLDNALLATNLQATARHALATLDLDLDELREFEVEPGLGNGGLGRLAACFLDSLATMSIPAVGYGIRYEYGIFQQAFNEEGRQVEVPDTWLRHGNPWEFPHPEMSVEVGFGGTVTPAKNGSDRASGSPETTVLGVPYNYMVPGYHNGVVNTLRLWRAQATNAFDLHGSSTPATTPRPCARRPSPRTSPRCSTPRTPLRRASELRLQQQYFFVACSINDFIHTRCPSRLRRA